MKAIILKIHDKALTLQEIRNSYNQSAGNTPCVFQIIITSPKAGEAITLSTKIAYSVVFTDAWTLLRTPVAAQ